MIKVGLFIVLLAVFAATLGPALTPYDPAAQTLAERLEPPSRRHPFGLDELGRDILSRLVSGAPGRPSAGSTCTPDTANSRGMTPSG